MNNRVRGLRFPAAGLWACFLAYLVGWSGFSGAQVCTRRVWCYTLDSTCGTWQAVPGDSGWLRWASHAHQGGKVGPQMVEEVGSPAQRSPSIRHPLPSHLALPIPLVQHKALSVSGPSEVTAPGWAELPSTAGAAWALLEPAGFLWLLPQEIPSDEALLVSGTKSLPGNPPVCQSLLRLRRNKDLGQGLDEEMPEEGKDGAGKWSQRRRFELHTH